jgi:phage recombination protein Bet
MSEKLAVMEKRELEKDWKKEVGQYLTKETIKNYLCPEATDEEVFIFGKICSANLLNPFIREAYLIKYKKDSPASIVVGKDAYFRRADSFPQYDGLKSGIITITGSKRNYQEGCMVFGGDTLVGAWAEVYRKDRKISFRSEVSMSEYEGKKYNWKTRQLEVNSMWKSKPATMITKVAEVQALRKAFPQLSGMYIAEEIQVDGANTTEESLPKEPINVNEIKQPERNVVDVSPEESEPEENMKEPETETYTESEQTTTFTPTPETEKKETAKKSTAVSNKDEKDKQEKQPTDFRVKQINSLIASLPAESDEDKADFVKLLQVKVGIAEDKTMENLTQEEAVKMVEILKKQVGEAGQDTPPEEPPDEPPAKEKPKPKAKSTAKKSTTKKSSSSGNKCTEKGCGKFVSKKVAEFSKKKYGRIVCFNCQEKLKGEA